MPKEVFDPVLFDAVAEQIHEAMEVLAPGQQMFVLATLLGENIVSGAKSEAHLAEGVEMVHKMLKETTAEDYAALQQQRAGKAN